MEDDIWDWEDGYEQLPVLFNAIKGGRYSFVFSDASLSVSRPLGTVVQSSPLTVHS
jgi:hypothetical protein